MFLQIHDPSLEVQVQKEIDSINKLISDEYSAKATILVSNSFHTLDGQKLKYREDFEYS